MQMSISSTVLHDVRGVTIYKIIAGADSTLASYNDEVGAAAHDSLDGDGSLQHQEWRALYTQFQQEHVLGTLPYRWENPDTTEATLVSVSFEALDIVVLDGPLFHDGSVGGRDKALAVKQHLGLDAARPLMAALGDQGTAALVRETEEEWELVIPHSLLSELKFSERVVATFQRHPQMQITHKWRAGGGVWEAWEDGVGLECIGDLDMSWLPSAPDTTGDSAVSKPAAGEGPELIVCDALGMSSFELPLDIAGHIICFILLPWDAATSPSLASLSVTSKSWSSLMLGCPDFWAEIAAWQWPECTLGSDVLGHYAQGFPNPWVGVVATRNQYGAYPSVLINGSSLYRYSRANYHFECKVLMMRWDRSNGIVQIFFDAKGESDLRDPFSSHVLTGATIPGHGGKLAGVKPVSAEYFVRKRGHYKGWLGYEEDSILGAHPDHTIMFCFANWRENGDYPPVALPQLTKAQWIDCCYTQTADCFFEPSISYVQSESFEEEQSRWAGLPSCVRNRQFDAGGRPWGSGTSEANAHNVPKFKAFQNGYRLIEFG